MASRWSSDLSMRTLACIALVPLSHPQSHQKNEPHFWIGGDSRSLPERCAQGWSSKKVRETRPIWGHGMAKEVRSKSLGIVSLHYESCQHGDNNVATQCLCWSDSSPAGAVNTTFLGSQEQMELWTHQSSPGGTNSLSGLQSHGWRVMDGIRGALNLTRMKDLHHGWWLLWVALILKNLYHLAPPLRPWCAGRAELLKKGWEAWLDLQARAHDLPALSFSERSGTIIRPSCDFLWAQAQQNTWRWFQWGSEDSPVQLGLKLDCIAPWVWLPFLSLSRHLKQDS